MTNEVVDQNKSFEDLKSELDVAVTKYENLTKAHDKLKEDLKEYKTKSHSVDDLQKQVEELTNEKTKITSDFDAFKTNIKQEKAKTLLNNKLTEAGAKSTSTAMKLLDMTAIEYDNDGEVIEDSVNKAIDVLKAEHEIIFSNGQEQQATKPTAPSVKLAVDTVTKSAYETEMAAAVKSGSQRQLEEVFAKYKGTKR